MGCSGSSAAAAESYKPSTEQLPSAPLPTLLGAGNRSTATKHATVSSSTSSSWSWTRSRRKTPPAPQKDSLQQIVARMKAARDDAVAQAAELRQMAASLKMVLEGGGAAKLQELSEEQVDILFNVVVNALVEFFNIESVQERGLLVLGLLLEHCQSSSLGSLGRLEQAAEMLVAAMKRYPENSGIQEHACRCVAELCRQHSRLAQTKLAGAGGLEAVTKAFGSHIGVGSEAARSLALQRTAAAAAVAALCTDNQANTVQMSRLDCEEAILSAMACDLDDDSLQESCCDSLKLLAESNPDVQTKLGRLFAIEALLRVHNWPSSSEHVKEKARGALEAVVSGHAGNGSHAAGLGAGWLSRVKAEETADVKERKSRRISVLTQNMMVSSAALQRMSVVCD
eukprot:TRINITY_DN4244_c0_g1_i1.p1 TRINITY_DN4244_c0_g1~~TRINITY_DN4244_c0_g1_i1.p1  ORF type:complete len:397 (-),score=106.59 TRINITY_DN4244_c0_g1_i1:278-1468(-)